jgi:hypothetical protein
MAVLRTGTERDGAETTTYGFVSLLQQIKLVQHNLIPSIVVNELIKR